MRATHQHRNWIPMLPGCLPCSHGFRRWCPSQCMLPSHSCCWKWSTGYSKIPCSRRYKASKSFSQREVRKVDPSCKSLVQMQPRLCMLLVVIVTMSINSALSCQLRRCWSLRRFASTNLAPLALMPTATLLKFEEICFNEFGSISKQAYAWSHAYTWQCCIYLWCIDPGMNFGSLRRAKQILMCCRYEGLTHMGPLEDPVKLAVRVTRSFTASKDKDAWAALPVSESIPVQDHSKLWFLYKAESFMFVQLLFQLSPRKLALQSDCPLVLLLNMIPLNLMLMLNRFCFSESRSTESWLWRSEGSDLLRSDFDIRCSDTLDSCDACTVTVWIVFCWCCSNYVTTIHSKCMESYLLTWCDHHNQLAETILHTYMQSRSDGHMHALGFVGMQIVVVAVHLAMCSL